MSEEIPEGAKVEYHGSLTEYYKHNPMTYHGSMPDMRGPHGDGSGRAHVLIWGPGRTDGIMNIRRASFTVLEDD